jgi:hypothetical protein
MRHKFQYQNKTMVMKGNEVLRTYKVAQKSCVIKVSLFFAGKEIEQSLTNEDNIELILMRGRPEIS